MELQNGIGPVSEQTGNWLVACVTEEEEFTGVIAELDRVLEGQLTRLREREDLTGKLASMLVIPDVPSLQVDRLLLVGLGKAESLTVGRLNKAAMCAARKTSEKNGTAITVLLPENVLTPQDVAETFSTALVVGSVGQAFHKAEPKRFPFESITLHTNSEESIADAVERGAIIGDCMNYTRELVNRPAQEIFPETFAEFAESIAEDLPLTCTILDEDQMDEEQMHSLLMVGIGSDRESRLVVLDYQGAGEDAPVLGLCGKGVTFDSGGLSLKTNESMLTMKCDMAGAATVMGVMTAVARLELPVNVCGFMGMVENMPSGASFKLGDILTARNGKTIEVLNTDAEGRLVLADVLSYAVDTGVDKLIDLATLTGACVVALGMDVAGAFTNDEEWCAQLLEAAKDCGEDIWQLPMMDLYDELLESEVADIKNVGGRWGGATTAAKFLQNFVSDKPWVHLDIAGPSFAATSKPYREGGGTGCMVRTLVELAERFGAEAGS